MSGLVVTDLCLNGVFKEITFDMLTPAVYGIVGNEKSGVKELVKVISGFTQSTSGTVTLGSTLSSDRFKEGKFNCSVSFEESELYPRFTLYENLYFYVMLCGYDKNITREKVSAIMRDLNIWEYRAELASKAPEYVVKKLKVAISVIRNPDLLIIENIDQNTDENTVKEIYDYVLKVKNEKNISAIITSENGFNMDFFEKVFVMKNGRMIARGTKHQLMTPVNIKDKAYIKISGEIEEIDGFSKLEENSFTKEIEKDNEMIDIIKNLVNDNISLIEAKILRPSIVDIIQTILVQEIENE